MKQKVFIFCLLVFLFNPLWAFAFKVGDVEFNEICPLKRSELILNGAGLKRFFFIKVVCVGLYLPDKIKAEEILENVPKRLVGACAG